MPKLKTRRAVKKRLRFTGTGKIRRPHAFRSHLMTHRSRKRKRRLRQGTVVSRSDEKRIERLLPYLT